MTKLTWLTVLCALLAGLAACGPADNEAAPATEPAMSETKPDSLGTLETLEARVDALEARVDSVLATHQGASAPRTSARSEAEPVPAPRRQAWPDAVTYQRYHNEQVGFSLDYPANVLSEDEALFDGAGRKFASADGRATLVVFGTRADTPQALERLYREELADEDSRVTYKTLHDDWFVVSGYVGDRIFYERALQRGGVLKVFLLLYDEADKAYFDPITERISFSFEG